MSFTARASTFFSSASLSRVWLKRHIMIPPEMDSMKLSIPNPTSAMLEASPPARIESTPSNTLYVTVK